MEVKRRAGIKNWPEDDRPRERLLKRGAKVLSNSELIREKQIRAVKIGQWRVKPEDMKEFIQSRTNR